VNFSTIGFIFVFLPLSALLFYVLPRGGKVPLLLAVSLLFYTLLDPTNLLLMLLSVTYDYGMAFLILKAKGELSLRKLPLLACVVKNLSLIVVFGLQEQLFGVAMPLGLLVYSLTGLGYVIDVYRGDEPFERSWLRFALYCCFFGKIFVGPLLPYGDLRQDLQFRKASLSAISDGLTLFVCGLGKQVILAQSAGDLYRELLTIPAESRSVLGAWLLLLSFSFWLYYTLSGYCDMARGLGQIFSLKLPENFHYPFQSRTVSDFFNRFNITVTQFANRYVYVILGGDTNGRLSTALNTLLTAMLLGLWFGIRLNYVAWGCYFGLLMLLERFVLGKLLRRLPSFFTRLYTFSLVLLSFPIFLSGSLREAASLYGQLFGLAELPLSSGHISYLLSANGVLLGLCFFFLTNLGSLLVRNFRKYCPSLSQAVSVPLYVGLLGVTVSLLL